MLVDEWDGNEKGQMGERVSENTRHARPLRWAVEAVSEESRPVCILCRKALKHDFIGVTDCKLHGDDSHINQ